MKAVRTATRAAEKRETDTAIAIIGWRLGEEGWGKRRDEMLAGKVAIAVGEGGVGGGW